MKNNYIFISGGTSEIGQELIKKFSDKYNIIFSYNKSKINKKKILVKNNNKNKLVGKKIDLSNIKSINNFSNYLKKNKIKIKIFVHLANIHFDRSEFMKIKEKDFVKNIYGNCIGSFALIQKVVQCMKKKDSDKSIYLLSSQSVDYGGNKISPYVASKGFLNTLGLSLSKELGKYNIRVNTITLGKILSKNMKKNFKRVANNRLADDIPLSRLGNAKEVANLIISLNNNNPYLSGANIKFTGGR